MIAACALSALLIAQEGGAPRADRVRELVRLLGDDAPEVRERAEADLLGLGTTMDPLLEELLKGEMDADVRERLTRTRRALPFTGLLGVEHGRRFGMATSGMDRIDILASAEKEGVLEKLDGASMSFLARAALDVFPWKDRYEDARHQRDLFALRERIVPTRSRRLSEIFALMTDHSDPYVRLHAVGALEEMEIPDHASVLVLRLGDSDVRVRSAAAKTLLRTAPREHGTSVARLLADPENDVRAVVAFHLEERGVKEAIPALREAKEHETDGAVARIIECALRSLETMRGERRSVSVIKKWVGPDSALQEAGQFRIEEKEEWVALWKRHASDSPAPEVDFEACMAVAVFDGATQNSRGIGATAFEDDEKITLRLTDLSYQTMGGGEPVTPYGIFVLSRSKKPVVLETVIESMRYPAPTWEQRGRLE